jgi:tellurite resistance protein TehA-like permease
VRAHLGDPAIAPFLGAWSMGILTVGAGALLVGDAVAVDLALWTLGTVIGLGSAVAVPYALFNHHELRLEHTLPAWLMPVVPPMVSAATGAALVAHVPHGQAQLTLLLACYAMFGLSLVASLVVIALLWARLTFHGPVPAPATPTLWMVLGPLGQSITAVNLLGTAADGVTPYAPALHAFGVVYGVPVLGFALLWLAIAAASTLRTAPLAFGLSWWSFTFPVGTCITGCSELAVHTGAHVFAWLAVALFALLVVAWIAAASGTVRGRLEAWTPRVGLAK